MGDKSKEILKDPDFGYIYKDILECMGEDELTTLEIAQRMHMAMEETYWWLTNLEGAKVITLRRGNNDERLWRKK